MNPPTAAPMGLAPWASVNIADTRPSRCAGVTACRSVPVAMTQIAGPAPIRKKLKAASQAEGTQSVRSIATAEASPHSGPIATSAPNETRFATRVAASAPATMPMPSAASVAPTLPADSPSVPIA